MNKEHHYPSIELCKELQVNGFPKTELQHVTGYDTFFKNHYYCIRPSIAELIDALPEEIPQGKLTIDKQGAYYKKGHMIFTMGGSQGILANSLAMLWNYCKIEGLIPNDK